MNEKKFISLIFGGTSNEHSISIKTASFIYEILTKLNIVVQPIFISKENEWFFKMTPPFAFPFEQVDNTEKFFDLFLKKNHLLKPNSPLAFNSKMAFIGLHGSEGEDGTIQGFLKTLKIPFVGSDITASSIAMNKMLANQIFYHQKLNIPKSQVISYQQFQQGLAECKFDFPVFIKPVNGGSSVNSWIIDKKEDFDKDLKSFFKNQTHDCLLQEYIQGKEVSCCVIETKNGEKALPITEIKPNSTFFDFHSKYQKGAAIETTPANISIELTKKIQSMSIIAHQSIHCKDYSRSDFIIKNNKPYILELNTLPGMTKTSFLPQQLTAANISFPEFFQYFIQKYL